MEVNNTTKMMEDIIDKDYIIIGLNDTTRPFAEKWFKWANLNIDKAVNILDK